jgi:hypothetical protein
MKTFRGFLVSALIVLSAVGCLKQDTVTGPAGPSAPPDKTWVASIVGIQ